MRPSRLNHLRHWLNRVKKYRFYRFIVIIFILNLIMRLKSEKPAFHRMYDFELFLKIFTGRIATRKFWRKFHIYMRMWDWVKTYGWPTKNSWLAEYGHSKVLNQNWLHPIKKVIFSANSCRTIFLNQFAEKITKITW